VFTVLDVGSFLSGFFAGWFATILILSAVPAQRALQRVLNKRKTNRDNQGQKEPDRQ